MKKRKKQSAKKRLQNKLSTFKNPNGTQKETKIESIVRTLLEKNNINFSQEHPLRYGKKNRHKKFDFYIWENDTNGDKIFHMLIECHGNYWHSKALYNGSKTYGKLDAIQKKNVRNDFIKRKLAQRYNIPLIAFWEDEINTNPEKIETQIFETVNWARSNGESFIPEEIFPIYEYKVTKNDRDDSKNIKRKKLGMKKFKEKLKKKV